MSSVRRTGSNQAITDALILSGGAATLGVAYVPGVSSWLFAHGATCPVQRAFGWQCPFCGMTHGTVALLHGDLAQVFRTNPFAIVYVVGLALMIGSVFGFVWAPFRSKRLEWAKTAVIVGAAFTFSAYSIGRNLV